MKLSPVITCFASILIGLSVSAVAQETGTESVLPDPEILASGIIIDCGQWPPAQEQELGANFRNRCERDSKRIGYKQAWVVKMENIPEAVKEHRRSFSCPEVAEQNNGYACIGKPGR